MKAEKPQPEAGGISFFERYLSLWVALCIGVGVALGHWAPGVVRALGAFDVSGINLVVAVLVWAMIFPMMVQVDFGAVRRMGQFGRGLALTLTVNWLIKPFTMAALAWLFFTQVFAPWLDSDRANDYLAGAILLGAAPCTAMVFVWSYLARGNATYTLVQVAVNDLVLLIAFVPLVQLLLGITAVPVPYDLLLVSVLLFVAVPLAAGWLTNRSLIQARGQAWFESQFLPKLKPLSITALLTTLVLLFAFQGAAILQRPLDILIIAIPLTLQTYGVFGITWGLGRWLKLPFAVCAPAGFIGASNFFELAVAVAIAIYGLESGAALATVVGVLIEVPVMLSLVALANRWRY
jgi:ACR3 family arsenite transporter